MLSTHSFNALLKTLEEPPPHVKFLLATTDPQKLPVTVLSRCLQFNLKRLPVAQIAGRMRTILEKEVIAFDAAALRLIAQAADGSMRDALSLLDQLIAFGGGAAREVEARAMLGTVARDHVVRLAELLGAMNVPEVVRCAQSLEEWAPDYAQVLDELAALLVRVALKQAVSDFEGDELYPPDVLERLAAALAAEDVQLFYQTAVVGRRDLVLAPDPRAGFQMTLLRMIAFRPAGEGGTLAADAGMATGTAARAATDGGKARQPASGAASEGRSSMNPAPGSVVAASPPSGIPEPCAPRLASADSGVASPGDPNSWATLLSQLELQGAARQLASHCALLGREGGVVRLALDGRHKLMRTPSQEEKLAQALSKYFGQSVRLEFVASACAAAQTPADADQHATLQDLEAARRSFESDPGVQMLRDRFGATLLPDTIRPVK
jgi:DNA polymerase-3 subunit gamma/tau